MVQSWIFPFSLTLPFPFSSSFFPCLITRDFFSYSNGPMFCPQATRCNFSLSLCRLSPLQIFLRPPNLSPPAFVPYLRSISSSLSFSSHFLPPNFYPSLSPFYFSFVWSFSFKFFKNLIYSSFLPFSPPMCQTPLPASPFVFDDHTTDLSTAPPLPQIPHPGLSPSGNLSSH